MPLVVLEVVLLFPLVTLPNVQYLFPRNSRIPGFSGQGAGRAGIYTAFAFPAVATLFGRPTRKFHVRENGTQSHPGSKGLGDQLAMAADPPKACQGCSSFMRKARRDLLLMQGPMKPPETIHCLGNSLKLFAAPLPAMPCAGLQN